MAQYIIDIGAVPDDGQGDPLRTAFDYTNENFNQIFAAGPVLSNIQIGNNTITTTVLNSNLILSPSGIGRVQFNNTLFPRLDNVYDIGTPSLRFNSIYLGSGGIDSTGRITTTGNITAGYFIGNGSQLTGIVATTGSEVVNGTSNILIPSAGSNIFVTVNGTSNVVTFAPNGMYVAGEVSATGNISGNYILGNGALLTGINIGYGNANVAAFLPTYTGNLVSLTGPVITTANVTGGNLRTAGQISATGNITGGNVNTGRLNAGYITTGTTISAIGNIATSSYFIGDGSLLTGINANYGNANVASFLPTYTGNLVSLTGPVTTTANVTGGNLRTSGSLLASGNITAANLDTNRVNAANITSSGSISAVANIATGAYFIGDGSQLTNLPAGNYSNANVAAFLPTYTGSMPSMTGLLRTTANIIGGNISIIGNITGGNVDAGRVNAGNVTASGPVSASGNITTGAYFIGDGSLLTGINTNYSNANVAAFLPTYTGNLVSLTGPVTTTANVTGGNLRTAGQISATGNIISGNVDTGQINAANITSSGPISAVANIATGAYFIGDGSLLTNLPLGNYSNANVAAFLPTYTGNLPSLTGLLRTTANIVGGNISAVGNITGGNVDTGSVNAANITSSASISAVANIATSAYFIGDGSQLTNLPAGNYSNANVAAFLPTYTGNLPGLTGLLRTTANIAGGNISIIGNITGGNVDVGQVNSGNITSAGAVSAVGNIVTGAYFVGDGSQLTNLPAGNYSNANVAAFLPTYTGNLVSLTGPVTTTANVTGGNFVTTGQITATGNATFGNVDTTNLNANNIVSSGNISVVGTVTANVLTGATVVGTIVTATANVVAGNVTTTGQVVAAGNIQGGNLNAPGGTVTSFIVSATGKVQGGNLVTTGFITATGNITGGNVDTGNLHAGNISVDSIVSAVGNVYANNFIGNGLNVTGNISTTNISATGNISGDNLLLTGIISTSGNVTAGYFIGNGSQLTGLVVSAGNSLVNGNSNVAVAANGNVTVSSAGVSNVATFANTGAYILGTVSATGNVTGNYLFGNGAFISGLPASYSNANVAAFLPTYTGNLPNLTGLVSTTGNVVGSYFIGNGSLLTGLSASNVNANTLIGTTLSSNVLNSSLTSVGNLSNLRVTGNATVGNVLTGGQVSASGNVTGNYILGNGALLTGVITSVANINNGTSNVTVVSSGGNVTVGINGTGNVAVFASTGEYITGVLSASGNVTGGNILTTGLISATSTITSSANITGGNLLTAGLLSATANITGGNILTGGLISATGNITGSNINATNAFVGNISVTGNVIVDTLTANTTISAGGNITGGNLLTAGLISATSTITSAANITGGNLSTAGLITASGNILGNNIFASGFASVAGNVIAGNVNTSAIRPTSGGLTISTAAGNLNLQPAGNIVLANTFINSVAYPEQDTDAATKLYVDNMVSTALSFHAPVYAATTTTLAATTSGTITYAQPNGVSNGVGAYLSTTGSFNLIDTANVQTAGTRILVKNEGNAVYNGVYTWSNATVIVRSTDADQYGPNSAEQLSLNDYFFTTNGNVNAGSAFVVNEPTGTITFGTSNISFALFSQSTTYTANTDAGLSLVGTQFNAKVDQNTTAFDGSGNIIVKAGANLTTPNIGAATGTSLSLIGNVNSGNVNTGGLISATGNITGGNLITGGLLSATGNATLGNVLTGGLISATGNATLGNVLTDGLITATGNIQGGNVLTSGLISVTGNATLGNVLTGGLISSTGNIAGGNLNTNGILSVTGNIISVANITGGNILTGGLVSSTGNITGGNVLTSGLVSATGNVSGNFFIGNGSQLTGVIASGGQGNTITLGTPTDGNLTANVAYPGWTTGTFVTDGLDDLNQVALNIANSTYVGNAYITANVYSGPSPLTLAFTSYYIGNPNSFLWQFGDGTANATTANAVHTFSNASGGTFTVTFTAFNTNGTYNGNAANGAKGSTSTANISNIVLYTPSPIPSFTLSSNSFNTGNTITITNTSQYVVWYDLSFGDGTANFTAGPGLGNTSFTNVTHQYNSVSSNADSLYSVILSGTSNTAGPGNVTVVSSASNVKVYAPQTSNVFVTANRANVINGVGGISFRNDSNGTPGNTASFGAQQLYNFNYGDGNVGNVNVGTGIAGNPSAANVTNTFALSAANQAANAYQQFTANLFLYTGYSTSPAKSGNITITVEPQTRANYIGTTANVITDATANTGNARVGYLYTDYNSSNRSTFTFLNTSQNSNLANWSWGDSTFSNGVSNVGNTLHTYNSTGAFTVALTANGTPNGITSTAQSNTISNVGYIFIANNPTAPTNLSGFSNLAIANTSEGTSPLLAAGARDASGGNIVANGTSVTRFATTTTIATAGNIVNANTGISSSQLTANLFAYVNNADAGNVTFSNVSNTVGTTGALVVTQDRDLHVANAAVPSYFYKVFNANIACALSSLGTGYNNYKLVDSVTGNTNYAGFVKDNLNTAPSLVTANTALVEATAGTYRYISGIPYYNTGSPTITIANLAVANLSGQTFRSADPFVLASGTVSEGSGAVLSATQTKALGTINNVASSFLTGSNLNANVGVASTYTLGNMTANLTGANNVVATLQANIFNVVGTSTTVQLPANIQMYAGANSGINEQSITCTPTANTQAAIRIVMSTAGNTPTFANSINYYTSNAWSGAQTIAGTPEAVVRYGVLKQYAVDLSTGYLPVGPNLSVTGGRTSTQYFTFAFARPSLANFDIRLTTTTGVAGVWLAAPGTTIDSSGFSSPTPGFPGPTSTINGWLEASTQYAGSGVPGAAIATGGNGSNGCALTGADVIPLNTAIANVGYTMTLGSQNAANSTGTNILIRIALTSGQSITALSIGVAA